MTAWLTRRGYVLKRDDPEEVQTVRITKVPSG